MATRRERVVIEADDRMTSEMARVAASVALVRSELDRLNRTTVNVNVGVDSSQLTAATREAAALRAELDRISRTDINARVTQTFTSVTRGSQQANGSIGQTGDSINQLTGRLSLLADAALILGPGLIPIAAVGSQALGGLTLAATAAAVAGGSAVVAFQGLGDAVEAVQEYQLDPTVEGLEKAREAMSALGPDAQRFVMEFQKFRPVLGDIKDAASAGWFPGLTESLSSFEKLGPVIEDIFFKAGEAGGFLVDGAADSLASERWAPFMEFIADEVPTAMGALFGIMGDLAHGAAEMFQAFDPGNDAFLGWLEDVAEGFDNWASSSQGQESIQGFLEYARQNGPAVADLFSSLVGALSAIVQAAAPLGGPVLSGLTAVADMVKVIADSDMATPLLLAVAALRIFNRLQVAAIATRGRLNTAMSTAVPTPAAPTAAQQAAMAGMSPAMQAALTGARAADVRRAQAQARSRMVVGGGSIALAGGLLASGAADEVGLTNTAMLTLAGSLAGPVGAALGATAGLAIDAAAANNTLTESLEAVNGVIDSGDFAAVTQGLAQAQTELDAFKADMAPSEGAWGNFADGFDLGKVKNDLEGAFGKSDVEEAQDELARLEARAKTGQEAVGRLGEAFGMTLGPIDGSARSIEQLNGVLEAAKPAMDALGISTEEYLQAATLDKVASGTGILAIAAQAGQAGGLGADAMAEAIRKQSLYMDSAQGRADNYTAALGALVREEGSAAEQARGLNDALDALVDPALNAEEALSNYREALKEIQNLNADGGFTVKNAVGRENLSQTRDFRQDVEARLVTMVEANRTEEEVARALENSRKQFIQSGIAANFSARQMKRRADAIGLTPKLVETTFKALGIGPVERKTTELRGLYQSLPKDLRTHIRNEGIPKSMSEARKLADELNLTAKERRALVRLVTEGEGNVAAAKRLMDSINSKTVTLTTIQRTFRTPTEGRRADGGSIPKDGGPYTDRFLYMLAPGEEVITNRNGEADRFRADRAAGRIPGYATGGTVGWGPNPAASNRDPWGIGPMAPDPWGVGNEAGHTARGLKALRKELKESTATLAKERARRADLIGTIRGNFTTDPFADDGGIWGSGSDPIGSLMGDVGDLRRFSKLVKGLDKRGLNGGALAEADTLAEVEVLSGMSNAELARYERLYNQRQRLAANVGGQYATSVTGMTVKELKNLAAEVRRVEKAIKQEGQKDRKNRDDNTDKAGDDRRAAARRAAQRRRRNQG